MLALLVVRGVIAVLGMSLVYQIVIHARAYNSWRVLVYFWLVAAALAAHLALEAYTLIRPPGLPAGASLALALAAGGLVGLLSEKYAADQLRQKDAQKLLDQWRLMSSLANRRARELEILIEINRELASSLDLREVLQVVVDRARQLSGADVVNVFSRQSETGELSEFHLAAAASEHLRELPARAADLTAVVARTGQAAFISDVRVQAGSTGLSALDLGALASLPLRLEAEEVVGVMNVGFRHKHEFDDGEIRLLTALADAAALAVRNASLHERITRLAVTDELTGLPNRRRFLDALRSEIQRARRYQGPLTMMMVDLDRLKQINDQYGHAAGDASLRGVAASLRQCVRDTDLPARLGGDEFAVLLPETLVEQALAIAERIRATMEKYRVVVNGVSLSNTVSIGVVCRGPSDLQDVPSLIRLADDALYQSKTGGRNQVTLLDSSSVKSGIDAGRET